VKRSAATQTLTLQRQNILFHHGDTEGTEISERHQGSPCISMYSVSPMKIPAPLAIGKSVGAPLRLRGRPHLGRPHRAAPTVACRSVRPKQAWSSGFSLHGGWTARRLKSLPRGLGSGSAQPEGRTPYLSGHFHSQWRAAGLSEASEPWPGCNLDGRGIESTLVRLPGKVELWGEF